MKKVKETRIKHKWCTKQAKAFMSLPYTICLTPFTDPQYGGTGVFATIKEFPGCMSDGDTFKEAIKNLRDAEQGWLEASLFFGHKIPMPEQHNMIIHTRIRGRHGHGAYKKNTKKGKY